MTTLEKSKGKIPHPYKVPENFFSEFSSDILNLTGNQPMQNGRMLNLTKKVMLTAAAAVLVFFAFKGVMFTFHGTALTDKSVKYDAEIDAIYIQISEDDLTTFILDESNVDLNEILDFKTN